ncbi:autotransporter outer membrane beta-barrel domain-containing protein, partial [Salmonella enterica subsp. diarizonae]|nr:autotransporter outer membrane beta-barrel domain-containing protein [Salmonella enterica subsp. diarizonae]
ASVLMGLSLSAVAATASDTTPPAETAPAKPAKTFAGLAAPVKGENIQVTVRGVNSGSAGPLSTALNSTTAGSAAKAFEALKTAQGTYDKLTDEKKKLVTKLNDATTAKNDATQTWNDFGHKLSAANSVFTDNLNSMYGDGHNAFTVDKSSGDIVADVTEKDKSTYGQLLKAYDDLNTSVTNLNKAIVGDIEVSGKKAALNVFANGSTADVKKAAQKAEAQVFFYSNYINKALEVKTTELQLESVRNIVINNISTVLGQTDQTDKISDTTTTGSAGKNLSEFKTAYGEWSKATSTEKAAKETALATAFQTLVKTTGITGVTDGSTAEGVTFEKLADAWVKLTGDGAGSVAAAQKAVTDAKNYTATGSDTPHDLFDVFEKAHDTSVFTVIKALADADLTAPDGLDDAVKKLQAAYRVLLNKDGKGNGASQTEFDALDNLRKAAWKNHLTLSGMQAEYEQKKLDIQQAGNNRLNLLMTELPDQQAAFLKAQTEYQAAKDGYKKDSSVTGAWDALYGNDGKSGALGSYLDSLKATSGGIQTAINDAESTYKSIATDNTKTQEAKNTALYTLIGTQKTLAQEKLKLDTEYLKVLKTGVPDTLSSLVDNRFKSLKTLKADLNTADENKAKAKSEYIDAVKAYRDADTAYQASKSEADAATLATTKAHLMTVVGVSDISKLYVTTGKPEDGFRSFDELANVSNLSTDKGNVFSKYSAALEALTTTNGGGTEIQQARQAVVDSMNKLSALMPLSTPEEQTAYRTAYNSALNEVGVAATTADVQSTAPGAGKVTHILGSLTKDEIAQYNPVSGNYNSVIVNDDGKGNFSVKDSFTAKDLYTGTQDNPFTTTVLDVRALELGNGNLADPNTITVGETGSKATPVDVWAKTAGVKHTDNDETKPWVSAENGPAVKLSGNLRTATAQLDADGKPVKNEIVRGADQIHLQNVNIHNSFTLADRTKMLADDMAAITSEAADKLKLGQPADGVNTWQKAQTALLNSKYDNLKLTGLQIATKTVNPTFDLDSGGWKDAEKTVTPTDANILLDNLNITLQNDSVGGVSTAIALSGTGNHILANGGVFDAGQVTGKGSKANVLDFGNGELSATNNRVDFDGSVLKGDIVSTSDGNQVNLNNSTLTGNAASGDNQLALALNSSTWTGASGQNSPDVALLNNSVWNVKNFNADGEHEYKKDDDVTGPYSSVHTLALYGSNSINLVSSDGQAQLGGHGFAGTKSAVTLKVDNDLFSDGKGVTSVLAGTYSPDNLHSLTNTGSAGNYQFGTLNVDGLAKGGKYALSLESAGAEPYTIGGRLADSADATHAHEFVSYTTNESRVVTGGDGKTVSQTDKSDADFTSLSAPAELGVYQYAAEKVMDAANNRTNIYYRSTGQLSNSAATVVSLAAAPVDVANLQSDTLAKHMNSVRHGKDSGVWVSYFGGESRNTTASGPEYKLNTNGVMLGADTLTENNWLAGVAVSSARSDMSVMNSSGDLNSYGAQFYMSRRYDSGVFVDSALQFNHFSNTAKARMTDGQQAKA